MPDNKKDSTSTKVPKINMAEEIAAINAGKKGGLSDKERDSAMSTFNRVAWAAMVDRSGYDTMPKKKVVMRMKKN